MTPEPAMKLAPPTAFSDIAIEENGQLARRLRLPVYRWYDPNSAPRAIVVGVHGVTLDGKAFDSVARHLASIGVMFVALDMRGFGQWYHGSKRVKADPTTDYELSFDDLIAVLRQLRRLYFRMPVFCAGECIGATFCVRVAAERPHLVDGIILSSPPVRRFSYMTAQTLSELGLSLLTPYRQVDMEPFWKLFLSPDPHVVAERINDPYGRRHLCLVDLLTSNRFCRRTLDFARKVPNRMPALILQGTADCMMKPEGAEILLSELSTTSKSLNMLPGHGHLLLETAHSTLEVKDALGLWLRRNLKSGRPRLRAISR